MPSMPADVDAALRRRLSAEIEERPAEPQQIDAKSVADMVQRAVEDTVQRFLAAAPQARDGKDGVDGKSVDTAELASQIAAATMQILAALPAPKDGRDGKDGKDGRDAPVRPAPIYHFSIARNEAGLIASVVATPM